MRKLFQFCDRQLLKILVIFTFAFTVLYPKLPSIQVTHTWVYVRLEDFLIGIVAVVWFAQLFRKRVKLPLPEGWSIFAYWIVGFVSLLFSLIFIGPHLANYFPKIAALQYLRRIEYMILFFAAFSTIRKREDVKNYIVAFLGTISIVALYGLGQRFYQTLWHLLPSFFEKNPYCFPAFLTGNEEFAKGKAFCLPDTARIAATFGGHYDLAAYLVLTLPIVIALFIMVRKWYWKVLTLLIAIGAFMLLNFTSSRVSTGAYVVAVVAALFFMKKKKWIIPVLGVSFGIMLLFSGSALQRIVKTIQPVDVVTVNTNKPLPKNLEKIIDKSTQDLRNQSPESPPPGSVTIGGKTPTASSSSTVKVLTSDEVKKIRELTDINISTISGSFLIQKAYALDISFTTRFEAEWPRNWAAFIKYPLFGQGFSTLTLATDSDYLRALGETGVFGFLSFFIIFVILGIYLVHAHKTIKDDMPHAFVMGLAGGIVGLLVNALMIDVFEASKVAEPLWILLGIGTGILSIYQKEAVDYKAALINFFTSRILIVSYLFVATMTFFAGSINTFFIGDDFTWLHWAASATPGDIPKYFTDAQGFFYRPLDKTILYILYQLFSFIPADYHLFLLFLHFLMGVGVFFVANHLFKNKYLSFLGGLLFILLPSHAENVYWISTLSTNLSSVAMLFGLLAYMKFRKSSNIVLYCISLLMAIIGVLSYEMAIVFPLVVVLYDFAMLHKRTIKDYIVAIPFVLISLLYLILRTAAHTLTQGGDYAYNLYHFIPNLFGNVFGYLGLFVFGEPFMPYYIILRMNLKVFALPILVILVALIGLGIYGVRKGIKGFTKNHELQVILFSILLMLIGLLPFVGLGNISGRYGYFASVGFILLIISLVRWMITKLHLYPLKYIYVSLGLIVVLVSMWDVSQLASEQSEWADAGAITYNTLAYFRRNLPNVPSGTIFYFNNIPIRQKEAWIWPVGIKDGLWFIYRDDSIEVVSVTSIQDAIKRQQQDPTRRIDQQYIFSFDDMKKIYEVK